MSARSFAETLQASVCESGIALLAIAAQIDRIYEIVERSKFARNRIFVREIHPDTSISILLVDTRDTFYYVLLVSLTRTALSRFEHGSGLGSIEFWTVLLTNAEPMAGSTRGGRVVRWLKGLMLIWRHWRDVERLDSFDDHTLADIGLTRADLHDVLAEPRWRAPSTLLNHRRRERILARSRESKMEGGCTCRQVRCGPPEAFGGSRAQNWILLTKSAN